MSNETENHFERVLLNQRSLRATLRKFTLDQIDEGIAKMQAIREERYEAEKHDIQAREERQKKINEMLMLMESEGLSPLDLMGGNSAVAETRAKVRAKRPAKYEYTNENGEKMTWTGQGRQPRAIAEAIAAGRTLEEFEIKSA
ncbi:DNA-binding protein StpA [compost metagenome]